jgi:membrane protein DedA with SNARE-associated domain
MVTSLVEGVAGLIIWLISAGGYPGIVLLMAIESACVPLPSEIIMPFAGYLALTGRFSLAGAATAGAIGCNLGSTLAYWAGRAGGRPFIDRWGRLVLLTPDDLAKAEAFFSRHGAATVFIGRLLPVIRTFIALPAGLARMPQVKFQAYTFAGSWLWCYALAWAGRFLGEQWNSDARLRTVFHGADLAIVLLIGAGLLVLWLKRRPR